MARWRPSLAHEIRGDLRIVFREFQVVAYDLGESGFFPWVVGETLLRRNGGPIDLRRCFIQFLPRGGKGGTHLGDSVLRMLELFARYRTVSDQIHSTLVVLLGLPQFDFAIGGPRSAKGGVLDEDAYSQLDRIHLRNAS